MHFLVKPYVQLSRFCRESSQGHPGKKLLGKSDTSNMIVAQKPGHRISEERNPVPPDDQNDWTMMFLKNLATKQNKLSKKDQDISNNKLRYTTCCTLSSNENHNTFPIEIKFCESTKNNSGNFVFGQDDRTIPPFLDLSVNKRDDSDPETSDLEIKASLSNNKSTAMTEESQLLESNSDSMGSNVGQTFSKNEDIMSKEILRTSCSEEDNSVSTTKAPQTAAKEESNLAIMDDKIIGNKVLHVEYNEEEIKISTKEESNQVIIENGKSQAPRGDQNTVGNEERHSPPSEKNNLVSTTELPQMVPRGDPVKTFQTPPHKEIGIVKRFSETHVGGEDNVVMTNEVPPKYYNVLHDDKSSKSGNAKNDLPPDDLFMFRAYDGRAKSMNTYKRQNIDCYSSSDDEQFSKKYFALNKHYGLSESVTSGLNQAWTSGEDLGIRPYSSSDEDLSGEDISFGSQDECCIINDLSSVDERYTSPDEDGFIDDFIEVRVPVPLWKPPFQRGNVPRSIMLLSNEAGFIPNEDQGENRSYLAGSFLCFYDCSWVTFLFLSLVSLKASIVADILYHTDCIVPLS